MAIARQLFRFVVSGGIATSAHMLLMAWLIHQGSGAVLATSCGYGLGVCISYQFHRLWSFKGIGPQRYGFLKYSLVVAFGAASNALLVYVSHDLLKFAIVESQIAASAFVLMTNFIGARMIVFRTHVGELTVAA